MRARPLGSLAPGARTLHPDAPSSMGEVSSGEGTPPSPLPASGSAPLEVSGSTDASVPVSTGGVAMTQERRSGRLRDAAFPVEDDA